MAEKKRVISVRKDNENQSAESLACQKGAQALVFQVEITEAWIS